MRKELYLGTFEPDQNLILDQFENVLKKYEGSICILADAGAANLIIEVAASDDVWIPVKIVNGGTDPTKSIYADSAVLAYGYGLRVVSNLNVGIRSYSILSSNLYD